MNVSFPCAGISINEKNKLNSKPLSQEPNAFPTTSSPTHTEKKQDVFFKGSTTKPQFGMFSNVKEKAKKAHDLTVKEIDYCLREVNKVPKLADQVDTRIGSVDALSLTSSDTDETQYMKTLSKLKQLEATVDGKPAGNPNPFSALVIDFQDVDKMSEKKEDLINKILQKSTLGNKLPNEQPISDPKRRLHIIKDTGLLGVKTLILLSSRNESATTKELVEQFT